MNVLFRRAWGWLWDDAFATCIRNAGMLLGGSSVSSALALATTVLAARALGPEQFGALVLVQGYVAIVNRLTIFQSWQTLIKFGADALSEGDAVGFSQLVKFSTFLDGGSAVLGAVVAAAAVQAVKGWLDWTPDVASMATLYSLTIIFRLSGTPTAVLRLFGRFKALASQQVIAAGVRLLGTIVAIVAGAGLQGFLMVWLLSDVAGQLLLLALGWWELHRQGHFNALHSSLAGIRARFKGLWGFAVSTSLSATVRVLSKEFDIMVVGGMLGSGAAGLYKIAKQFSSILARISDPLYQAVYPDLVRLYADIDRDGMKRLILRTALLAGSIGFGVWLVVVFFGNVLIGATVGADYLTSKPVLVWYMLAVVVAVLATPLQPAMLAMGRAKMSFWIHLMTTGLYFPLLVALVSQFGLVGAGIAYLVYYLLWSASMAGLEWSLLKGG